MVAGEDITRQRLRVAFKLMLLIALMFFLWVGVAQFRGAPVRIQAMPVMPIDLSEIDPGQMVTLVWEKRPVLVYRRTENDIANLERSASGDDLLLDPSSSASRQPAFARNNTRSRITDWFVAINMGSDFGCPLERVSPADGGKGLFRDTCRGSQYDAAGRVLRGHYATDNLSVPDYTIEGSTLFLGDVNQASQ